MNCIYQLAFVTHNRKQTAMTLNDP